MVDWSAANSRTTGADSIWVAELIGSKKNIENFSTREETYDYLIDIISKAKEKQRLLIGLDFAFSYPMDSYDGFGCHDRAELWDLISKEIKDDSDNENNRFDASSNLNMNFPNNEGPFWGRPRGKKHKGKYPNLYNRRPKKYGRDLPREKRCIDILANGKSVWNVYNPGSVGSQTLMGIYYLQRLKERKDCIIWPFDELDDTKHVITEIYPSIWDETEEGQVQDERQVKTLTKNFAQLDKDGTLKNLFNAPYDYAKNITKKEGWMLGIDENGRPAKCP